ncbi:MAG: alpha/beta hydrolase family protein [Myxococcota bacterium]
MRLLGLGLLGICGCGVGTEDVYAPVCEEPGGYMRYSLDGEDVPAWPDDAWWVDGRLDEAFFETTFFSETPPIVQGMFEDMRVVDGVARTGDLLLRATTSLADVPATVADSLTTEALQLWELSEGEAPRRLGYLARLGEARDQVLLEPARPLRAATRHVLLATDALRSEGGDCMAPSSTMTRLLSGAPTSAREERVSMALLEDLATLGVDVGRVAVATAFTTHDGVRAVAEVAEDARARGGTWVERPVCETRDDGLRECEGLLEVWDYRSAGGGVDGLIEPVPWTLGVTALLPDGEGPFPVVMFGHGMSSDRGQFNAHQTFLTSNGMAIVAADALHHGDHPTAGGSGFSGPINFLGFNFEMGRLSGQQMRGSFVQSAIDRVVLMASLDEVADLDLDGVDDLDLERKAMLGVSLGGMIGAVQLAVSPEFDAALLPVSGGILARFVTDGTIGATLSALVSAQTDGPDEIERLLAMAQTAIDPADPAVFAAHLAEDRLLGGEAPHVGMFVSTFDTIVPPRTNVALARSLGLLHLGEALSPVDGLDYVDQDVIMGNAEGRTAGFIQLDRSAQEEGVVASDHWIDTSDEGDLIVERFFRTWLSEPAPEMADPYAILGTPPLSE